MLIGPAILAALPTVMSAVLVDLPSVKPVSPVPKVTPEKLTALEKLSLRG